MVSRGKRGCCGASASLSWRVLDNGRGCGREQKQRDLATLGTLVGISGAMSLLEERPPGSQDIFHKHNSKKWGQEKAVSHTPNFCWSLIGCLGVCTVCVVSLYDSGQEYRRKSEGAKTKVERGWKVGSVE